MTIYRNLEDGTEVHVSRTDVGFSAAFFDSDAIECGSVAIRIFPHDLPNAEQRAHDEARLMLGLPKETP